MYSVLVVDDEKIVRAGIVGLLPWKECNLRVVGQAANAAQALEALREHHIDLLFTDIGMPGMNGIELMSRVKTEFPHVRTVVLTCHQDFEYVQAAVRLGALDFLIKTQLEEADLKEILVGIVARYRESILPPGTPALEEPSTPRGGGIAEKIERAAQIARKHLATITQDQLAAQVGLSRGHFSHAFKAVCGQPFGEFITAERIDRAMHLLRSGDLPVYQIAEAVGFQDVKYFSRLFRNHTGITPSAFREQDAG